MLLRVSSGVGFANYDTLYALAWGQQLARGETPQYGIPIAPTPHPLVEALGLVARSAGAPRDLEDWRSPSASSSSRPAGGRCTGSGTLWFNRPAGAVAALLLLTRVPILSYGVRAYVDIPYLLLVLSALIVETRRRRAGAPVLALLALAGLLRPEAWVFSGLYWLYLALPTVRAQGVAIAETARAPGRRRLAGSAHSASPTVRSPGVPTRHPQPATRGPGAARPRRPVVWVASDWLVTETRCGR